MSSLRQLSDSFLRGLPQWPEGEVRAIFFRCLSHRAGLDRQYYLINQREELSPSTEKSLLSDLQSLQKNIPVQYVLGVAPFREMDLEVNRHVLIPRPESEELIDLVQKCCDSPPRRILDVGTGSGNLALALARLYPQAEVSALDSSAEALTVARRNAARYAPQVLFQHSDFLHSPPQPAEPWDLIVSNPPYVRQSESEAMEAWVLEQEPHQALFVPDEDALRFFRALIAYAGQHLRAGGCLVVEINQYLSEATLALFAEAGYRAERHRDSYAHWRFIAAQKAGG